MSPPWTKFDQNVEDTLARLIQHYDATLKVNGSNVLLCEYLAPRVAAWISAVVEDYADAMWGERSTDRKETRTRALEIAMEALSESEQIP